MALVEVMFAEGTMRAMAVEVTVVAVEVRGTPTSDEQDNSLALFSAASLSILAGLGMIVRGKKKE